MYRYPYAPSLSLIKEDTMNYCIVTNNTITNIVVADETVAAEMGLQPWYDGARIGDTYDPPPEPEPEPEPEYVTYSELAAAIREGVNLVD